MIHRANVRARIYVPNVQTKHKGNQKFSPRNFNIYVHPCRWCKRPKYLSGFPYKGLCTDCGKYLNALEGLDVWVKDCLENDVLISDMIDN